MFWRVTYYCLASLLTLGGASMTLIFIHPNEYMQGWRRMFERNKLRILGFGLWLMGVVMIVYGLILEGRQF